MWLKGPYWLSNPEMWPAVVQTKPSKEKEAEVKLVKGVCWGYRDKGHPTPGFGETWILADNTYHVMGSNIYPKL